MKSLAIWVTLLCTCLAWVIKGGSPEIDPKAELDPKAGPVYEASSPTPVLETPSSPARLQFIWENSAIRNDRHYNNGLDLSLTTRELNPQSIWAFPMRTLSPFLFQRSSANTDDRLNWTIFGQSIFTSSDHSSSNPDPKDRPYAGWLYTGLDFIQNHEDRELTSLEFLAGVVGPWAGGKQVQNWFHELLGQQPAQGWHYQLSNQFGATAAWTRRWRFNHDLGNGYSWEFIPEGGVTAGNVLTYGEIGGLVRFGHGLKADWGPPTIQPGYSGTSYFSAERGGVNVGYNIFAGVQGRVVAVNVFLDGNTFQNSRHVSKERAVGDLIVGLEWFYKDIVKLGLSVVARSPEFRTQRGFDAFGSFNASVAF